MSKVYVSNWHFFLWIRFETRWSRSDSCKLLRTGTGGTFLIYFEDPGHELPSTGVSAPWRIRTDIAVEWHILDYLLSHRCRTFLYQSPLSWWLWYGILDWVFFHLWNIKTLELGFSLPSQHVIRSWNVVIYLRWNWALSQLRWQPFNYIHIC